MRPSFTRNVGKAAAGVLLTLVVAFAFPSSAYAAPLVDDLGEVSSMSTVVTPNSSFGAWPCYSTGTIRLLATHGGTNPESFRVVFHDNVADANNGVYVESEFTTVPAHRRLSVNYMPFAPAFMGSPVVDATPYKAYRWVQVHVPSGGTVPPRRFAFVNPAWFLANAPASGGAVEFPDRMNVSVVNTPTVSLATSVSIEGTMPVDIAPTWDRPAPRYAAAGVAMLFGVAFGALLVKRPDYA